jgi:tRNA(Ile)-lysidine synthase
VQRKLFAALLQRVRRTLLRYQMLAPGDRILVAVSGGPDSNALLGVLAALAEESAVSVCAAHLNHGLRGDEALRDQRCAEGVARRLGIACIVGRSDAVRPGANLEARAREQRYAFLTRIAAEQGCTKIATGHTMDDQAETVLMRLLRGTGADGLAGIRPVREGHIIRPLIECSRAEVLAFLHAADLPFCEDSSNRDHRFLRNRVRHQVMPLLQSIQPAVRRRLAAAAEFVTDELALLRDWEAERLGSVARPDGSLPVAALLPEPRASSPRLVRAWLRARRGDLRGLTSAHFSAIARLAQGQRPNGEVILPGGQRVAREYGRLLFRARELTATRAPQRLLVPGSTLRLESGWCIGAELQPRHARSWRRPADLFEAVADAALVSRPLVVRTLRAGDRIHPLGLEGHRKLQDVLVDRKVPIRTRRTCPVVELDGEIFWVPGIVRSSHALVTPNTRATLRLTAQRPTIAGE